LIPPPPGSNTGGAQLNFESGLRTGTEVLLSIHGLKVIVIISVIIWALDMPYALGKIVS
jgi:hypothetical protein